MEKLSINIQEHLRHFFFNVDTTDSFTKWLYSCNEIEQAIGYENYYSLLEIDYRQRDNVYIAKQIVKNIYEQHKPDQIIFDQAISIAEAILSGSIGLHDGCRQLAHLSWDWDKYIDLVFTGYADELDRLDDTDFYDERIIDEVKKLLGSLQEGN